MSTRPPDYQQQLLTQRPPHGNYKSTDRKQYNDAPVNLTVQDNAILAPDNRVDIHMKMPPNRTIAESRFNRKRKESESKTRYNNQNSILMSAVTGKDDEYYIMVAHDTRIFYFLTTRLDLVNVATNLDVVCDDLTGVFLHLLTTAKYRILNAFYLLFQMTDRIALVSLFLNLFMAEVNLEQDYPHKELQNTVLQYKWGFLVLAYELFYDVMEYNVKIWILNRISIYVGILLFIAYFAVFVYYHFFKYPIVVILFGVRVVSFIVEQAVDYCMDVEMALDLQSEWMTEMKGIYVWDSALASELHRKLNIPRELKYVGSTCSWTWTNVFNIDAEYFGFTLSDDAKKRFNNRVTMDSGVNSMVGAGAVVEIDIHDNRNDEMKINGDDNKISDVENGNCNDIGDKSLRNLLFDKIKHVKRDFKRKWCTSFNFETGDDEIFHCHRCCLYSAFILSFIVCLPLIIAGIFMMICFSIIKCIFCSASCISSDPFKNTICSELYQEHSF